MRECQKKFDAEVHAKAKTAREKYYANSLDLKGYIATSRKDFNTALVNLHNAYSAGQKKYGYTYTLEQRK